MKTKIIKTIVLICCLAYSITTAAQEKKVDLKGTWTYSAPDAPYGYQEGIIEFKNTDNHLTVTVKIEDTSYTIHNVTQKEDQYISTLSIDGNDVRLTFTPGTSKITGTALVDGWEMPVTLTPLKNE